MKNILPLLFLLLLFSCTKKVVIHDEISAITNVKKAEIAVSVLGIDFSYHYENKNANLKFPMQSVYKFHIALAVLDQVDLGKISLDEKIHIEKSELMANTWSPILKMYPDANVDLSIAELIKYTVSESDNNGCDLLLKRIGGTKKVQDFLLSRKIPDTQVMYTERECHEVLNRQYGNYSTSKALTATLKAFIQGKLVSKSSTDFLYKVMKETTTGKNRLIAGLPIGTELAHKTGTSFTDNTGHTAATNDIGIVTLKNGKKYAISVLVSNSREKEMANEKLIADISKTVFEALNTY